MKRLILGKHPKKNTYGLWMSFKGKDASGGDSDLILSSDRVFMNIHSRGRVAMRKSGKQIRGQIYHGLNFMPIFIATVYTGNGYFSSMTPVMGREEWNNGREGVRWYTDPGSIRVEVDGNQPLPAWIIYTVFSEKLFD